MRYWTSDLHKGHKKIIEYCKRPFATIEEMDEHIQKYFEQRLKVGDTLVVVGDLSMKPAFAKLFAERLSAMGVHLILVPGNHDACFEFKGREAKAASMRGKYYQDGWKEIHQTWTTKLSNGLSVLVSHLPYGTESGLEYDQRYQEYRPKDQGQILIHGHLHGWYKKNGRMIDVGWDAHEGAMLSEDELIALIEDPRHFIPAHLAGHYEERKRLGLEKTNMKGLPGQPEQ